MKPRQWDPTSVKSKESAILSEGGTTLLLSLSGDRMSMLPAAATTSNATQRRPFAWLPMTALSLCMVVQTVALSSLVTYSGIYTQGVLNLPSLDMSGYYAGWLITAFTSGNLVTSYCWGRFADRFGRKPVMIIGVCATGICPVAFGLSTTYSSAIISWLIFGLATNIIPIGRIMAVELLGPEHAVAGMACFPGSRAIGTIVGPVMGGLLAQPAMSYPSVFSETGIFGRYPFLLPNLVVAFLSLLVLPIVILYLPETLGTAEGSRSRRHSSKRLSYSAAENGNNDDQERNRDDFSLDSHNKSPNNQGHQKPPALCRSPETRRLSEDATFLTGTVAPYHNEHNKYSDDDREPIWGKRRGRSVASGVAWCGPGGLLTPGRVRMILVLQCVFSASVIGFDEVYPLWLLASKDAGGLQWTTSKIGKVLGWAGVAMMLYQFIVYPALCRTVGIVRMLRDFGAVSVVLLLVTPDVQHFHWSEKHSCAVGAAVLILLHCTMTLAGTGLILVSANAVPANVRGQFGGLFAVAGSLGRFIGPPALSSLLAWSLQPSSSSSTNGQGGQFVDYHLVFVLEAILMFVVTLLGMKVLTLEALTIPIEDRPRLYEALEVEQRDDCSNVHNGVDLVEVHSENGACRRRDASTPS